MTNRAHAFTHVAIAACFLWGVTASIAVATDQPDQLVTGKKLLIKHKTDTTKSKIVFISKDPSFALPSPGNDPTVDGATLTVLDIATGTGVTFVLDSSFWSTIPNGFKYKNSTGSPCRVVIIKLGRLLKGVCKGPSQTMVPPLVGGLSAAAGVILRVGNDTIRYCAIFGASVLKNQGTGPDGLFKAKAAPAPVACPLCGNGTVNGPDEECDDGNNVSGDCCSAACQQEPNGNSCSDGDACTLNDTCTSGVCGGAPACGNGVIDAGCGEQCDLPDESGCDGPGLCKSDCTCAPAPTCDADPGRILFLGAGDDLCQNLSNQGTCESTYVRPGTGVTSCYWDGGGCEDCTPDAQAQGLCRNTCDPITCTGEPSRTIWAGGPGNSGCHQFDGAQTSCEQAFHESQFGGVASCFYDTGTDECRGCGPVNVDSALCANTCAVCAQDPTRTLFVGGPNFNSCHQFDGDQNSCEQAFHIDGSCGKPASCFWDFGQCRGCGLNNIQDGLCENTCETGPTGCEADPSRTDFVGGPGTTACHVHDGNPTACVMAFHRTDSGTAASCFYDFGSDACNGCGPNNEPFGECINTCASGPTGCENDPSRTLFLGGPGINACDVVNATTGAQVFCEQAFHLGHEGFASCFWHPSNGCSGCGPGNETEGNCQNTCQAGPVQCSDDPSRSTFAGGPSFSNCQVFSSTTGDSSACDDAFHLGRFGVSSCHFDIGNGFCHGCGIPYSGECTNECDQPSCDGDPSRTVYAGGTNSNACHQFDGLPSACNQAFHIGYDGVASCYYDAGECRGCGSSNEGTGDCTNTCPVCSNDPSRSDFVGGPSNQPCHEHDGNQTACELAFHFNPQLKPSSCYYDPINDECNGCGGSHQQNGECQNTCLYGPIACNADPARTVFAGGPSTGLSGGACRQFDTDPAGCSVAFHFGQYGGTASCFYDAAGEQCRGCGPGNSGDCKNSCIFGAIECANDPSRTLFMGGPNSSACHAFDGDQPGCEQAYHLDQNGRAASCFYDSTIDECRGCGVGNVGTECLNTCASGPVACSLDSSRATNAGGPSTGACQELIDEVSCMEGFHAGRCGVASCYWDGGSCQGCGPSNENSQQCFNTCVVP